MSMWAWSCWPCFKDLELVRDCKMAPHCIDVSFWLRNLVGFGSILVKNLRLITGPFMSRVEGLFVTCVTTLRL